MYKSCGKNDFLPTLLILMKLNKGTKFCKIKYLSTLSAIIPLVELSYFLKLMAQTNFGKS